MNFARYVLSAAVILTTLPSMAHELWLDGESYQLKQDANIVSNIKVGQNFNGSSYSFNPTEQVRFDVALGDKVEPVTGRLGDRPAVNIAPLGDGLNVLIYQSNVLDVFYTEWEKFGNFVGHKDFKGAEARHDARGLPREKFREAYARFAKSLIGVGNAKGTDKSYGLETEIVALENPYTDNVADGLDVKVLYREMPRVGAQVEVFERSPVEGVEVNVFTTQTNDEGIATIAVKPGFTYQLDAVVLREDLSMEAEDIGAVWETLWANMTFAVPE